jgi:hypothetical protein
MCLDLPKMQRDASRLFSPAVATQRWTALHPAANNHCAQIGTCVRGLDAEPEPPPHAHPLIRLTLHGPGSLTGEDLSIRTA